MVRLRLEERRRRARKNVELARRYVQEHFGVAAYLEREGRSSRFARERLQLFHELLEIHEWDLERIETALLEAGCYSNARR